MSIPRPEYPEDRVYIAGPMTKYKDCVGDQQWGRDLFRVAQNVWAAAGWGGATPIQMDDIQYGGPSEAMAAVGDIVLMLRDLAYIGHEADAVAVLPGWENSRGTRVEVHWAHYCKLPVYEAITGRTLWHPEGLCPVKPLAPERLSYEKWHSTKWGHAIGSELCKVPEYATCPGLYEDYLKDGDIGPFVGVPDIRNNIPGALPLVHATPPVHGPVNTESVLQEADHLINGPRQGAYGHPLDDFTKTGRIWGAILGIPDVPAEKVALCMTGVKISREVNLPKRDNRVDGAGYWGCLDKVVEERERRANDASHG